ncbi:hypothetical protein [uncultured Methanoregula sp.]|uniref:hypothetical protein n=1 Tax=uncultured Methanoregula sp. TaxID=1005933 RepID=UPI002AABCC49|nr:hypothetical protein [uncultured Methanoregula sp.]
MAGISGNEGQAAADVAGMTHNNPWFLITYDEIEEIKNQLRYFRNDLSGSGISHVQDIDNLLRTVRDRRP